MPFCSKCGFQFSEGTAFCPKCGIPVQLTQAVAQPYAQPVEPQEIPYYQCEGELIVKRTEHMSKGGDRTITSKAEGTIVVTNKAIYCAGNDYPFNSILSITKKGTISKSIVLTLKKNIEALSIEVELKTKDIDELFTNIERAKMSGIRDLLI